jgi:hypothetical protein
MGLVQAIGAVPSPLCLYSFVPLRWPVVATWAIILGLWTTVILWLWLGPEREVLLLMSGLMPKSSIMVYRLGSVVFVAAWLVMLLAFPTDAFPCAWGG